MEANLVIDHTAAFSIVCLVCVVPSTSHRRLLIWPGGLPKYSVIH